MKKITKVFVITVVLLLPVLVFLFLKQFGSNEFAIPVYYESGNPLQECKSEIKPHTISAEFVSKFSLVLPALVYLENGTANDLKFDLENALADYNEVQVVPISVEINSEEYLAKIMNCELVLGEDRFITSPIANKYVLIDEGRNIRGYFQVDELSEIERLDMELDILLNY